MGETVRARRMGCSDFNSSSRAEHVRFFLRESRRRNFFRRRAYPLHGCDFAFGSAFVRWSRRRSETLGVVLSRMAFLRVDFCTGDTRTSAPKTPLQTAAHCAASVHRVGYT